MQVGGNAVATAYFRQHGCSTKEAHAKYNSRAAQLYREKLSNLALAAHKKHGTELNVDLHSPGDTKDEDFFSSAMALSQKQMEEITLDMSVSARTKPISVGTNSGNGDDESRQPSIVGLHSPSSPSAPMSLPKEEPKSSLITKRKTPAKSGLGARKGLGAQKIKKSFSEIEAQAEMEQKEQDKFPPTPGEDQSTGFHDLGYREPKNLDPQKAKQAERLGMGVGRVMSQSHSASGSMDTIDQMGPVRTSQNRMDHISTGSRNYGGNDDFGGFSGTSKYDPPSYSGYSSRDRDVPSSQRFGKHSAFGSQSSANKPSNQVSSFGSMQSGSSSSKSYGSSHGGTSDEAQSRFTSAKSISSDQYFGRTSRDDQFEDISVSRFSGSSSISSDQYFGRAERKTRDSDGADFSGIKDGMSKISAAAGKMLESIQDRYHSYKS